MKSKLVKGIIPCVIGFAVSYPTLVQANEIKASRGTLSITGAVQVPTCQYVGDDAINIQFGTVPYDNVDASPEKEFVINLQCANKKGAKIKIDGLPGQDRANNAVFILGHQDEKSGAKGIGLAIKKDTTFIGHSKPFRIMDASNNISPDGKVLIPLRAKLVTLNTKEVKAGSIDTTISWQIDYE